MTIGDLFFEYELFRRDYQESIYEILGIDLPILPNGQHDTGVWSDVLTASEEAAYRAILGPVRARYESVHGQLPREHAVTAVTGVTTLAPDCKPAQHCSSGQEELPL